MADQLELLTKKGQVEYWLAVAVVADQKVAPVFVAE